MVVVWNYFLFAQVLGVAKLLTIEHYYLYVTCQIFQVYMIGTSSTSIKRWFKEKKWSTYNLIDFRILSQVILGDRQHFWRVKLLNSPRTKAFKTYENMRWQWLSERHFHRLVKTRESVGGSGWWLNRQIPPIVRPDSNRFRRSCLDMYWS